MKKIIPILFISLLQIIIIVACKKDNNSNPIKVENSIAQNISYNGFVNAIGSTDKLILKVKKISKSIHVSDETIRTNSIEDESSSEIFYIDTTKIVAVKNKMNEIYFSMRLFSKNDSNNNCFYNLSLVTD